MPFPIAYEIAHLAVGKKLPNNWTVMAYAVSDRHGIVLCSHTREASNLMPDHQIRFATWTVSNNDLRSTAHGHYHDDMNIAWTDFKARIASSLYLLS